MSKLLAAGEVKPGRPRTNKHRCAVPGCGAPVFCSNLCQPHYRRRQKTGDPTTPDGRLKLTDKQRAFITNSGLDPHKLAKRYGVSVRYVYYLWSQRA